MAGLVAAARGRQLGAAVALYEKGDRAGGSMLLSSCVVFRHRSFDDLRRECPGGDRALQRLVWERLDDALDWLESLGAEVVERETGNPLTTGRRFDPRSLTAALARAAGAPRLRTPLPADAEPPLVLATGGFQGDPSLVAEHIRPAAPLPLRANPWSAGDGLRHGLARGGGLSAGMDEFYGRALPDVAVGERDFVRLAQLYGRLALVYDEQGRPVLADREVSWSENDLAQEIARRPGAAAWYVLDEAALARRVRERTVAQMVEAARAAGGTVAEPAALPFPTPPGAVVAVRVRTAITHTIGGLRIDERARVLGADGVWAAGVDAGGIATGGYASGLAQALALGLTAAEDAVRGGT